MNFKGSFVGNNKKESLLFCIHNFFLCERTLYDIFQPKGADRKHKTDREKMEKRTGSEKVRSLFGNDTLLFVKAALSQIV